jgi:hypothetical protein
MHPIGRIGNAGLCEAHVIVCDELGTVRKEGRVREEIGDTMHKLKKVAAVAVMVGGLGLVGGGVASANGGHGDDFPFDIAIDNLQTVECEQDFESGAITITPPATGDQESNIGNFCTVVGSVED